MVTRARLTADLALARGRGWPLLVARAAAGAPTLAVLVLWPPGRPYAAAVLLSAWTFNLIGLWFALQWDLRVAWRPASPVLIGQVLRRQPPEVARGVVAAHWDFLSRPGAPPLSLRELVRRIDAERERLMLPGTAAALRRGQAHVLAQLAGDHAR